MATNGAGGSLTTGFNNLFGGLDNSIWSLLGGLGSLLFPGAGAMPYILGTVLGDTLTGNQRNDQAQANRDLVTDRLTDQADDISGFSPERPVIIRGGQVVSKPEGLDYLPTNQPDYATFLAGRAGAPVTNLDDIFDVGRTTQQAFLDQGITQDDVTVGTGFLNAGRGGIQDLFSSARDELRGLIDTDLSDVQAARLAGASASGQARQEQQQQAVAAQADRHGGLENLSRTIDDVGFQNASDLALQGAGIVGQTRMEELEAQKSLGGLLTNLYGNEAGILQNLLGMEGDILTGDVARRTGLATLLSSLAGGAAADDIAALEAERGILGSNFAQDFSAEQLEAGINATLASFLSPLSQYSDLLQSSFAPLLAPGYFQPDIPKPGLFGDVQLGLGGGGGGLFG